MTLFLKTFLLFEIHFFNSEAQHREIVVGFGTFAVLFYFGLQVLDGFLCRIEVVSCHDVKKVIITKTGKVIELSDEGTQTPAANRQATPTVIENINNIQNSLKDKSEENTKYVKAYVNNWIDSVMKTRFDNDTMLTLFEAEELRTKTFQVLKKLRADLI